MVERLFLSQLNGLQHGSLRITFPDGAFAVVGDHSFPLLELHIQDPRFFDKVVKGGSVGFGEAYVDGYWETPDLSALLLLLARNQPNLGRIRRGFSWVRQKLDQFYHWTRRNTLEQSKENIQEHYDLSNAFYEMFLDPTMSYSSAYFGNGEETLEQAQWKKIDRLLDLANVRSGDRVLEIGSGWGALAQRAAERGCLVKTITLSQEQHAYARSRFEQAGVGDSVDIEILDYREVEGIYDAIVSCEMIEAVGHEYLESYFATIARSLKPGGKAVLQAITIPDDRYEAYCRSCDWIQKHIFPGGHLPSPGEIRTQAQRAGGLFISQMEGFGADYAATLRHWSRAFNLNAAKIDQLGFDASFCRRWNYYLSYSEAGFMAGLIDVKHIVLERRAIDPTA